VLNVYTFLVDVTEAHIASLGGKTRLSTGAAMLLTWFQHLVIQMEGNYSILSMMLIHEIISGFPLMLSTS
jgi:hypothetical protein